MGTALKGPDFLGDFCMPPDFERSFVFKIGGLEANVFITGGFASSTFGFKIGESIFFLFKRGESLDKIDLLTKGVVVELKELRRLTGVLRGVFAATIASAFFLFWIAFITEAGFSFILQDWLLRDLVDLGDV